MGRQRVFRLAPAAQILLLVRGLEPCLVINSIRSVRHVNKIYSMRNHFLQLATVAAKIGCVPTQIHCLLSRRRDALTDVLYFDNDSSLGTLIENSFSITCNISLKVIV